MLQLENFKLVAGMADMLARWSYYTDTDTIAQVTAANYFVADYQNYLDPTLQRGLQKGDVIQFVASDGVGLCQYKGDGTVQVFNHS